MRFFTILAATCAIVISANASSIEKLQTNSNLNSCKDTLEKGLTHSKEAKQTFSGLDMKSFKSAKPIDMHLKILVKDLESTSKYCCISSGADVSSEEIRADIEKTFNTYYQIISDLEYRNPNFFQDSETLKLTQSLAASCKSKFKGDPSKDLQIS